MSNSEGQELAKKPSPGNDVESTERETPAPELTAAEAEVVGVGSVLRRSRRESFVRKVSVGLRALGFVFSVLSFIIMLSNNHGNGRKYGEYEEYRYLLAIAMFSTLYTGLQSFRHINQLCTGKEFLALKTSAWIDFVGDQIMAYMLLSSASSAIPMTNRIREGGDNIFTDSCAASISMSLLAFFTLACSSLIAGYKLSNQSSI